jgi:hypothetical protein
LGQQQLLLIVLGVIIVGIAVIIGIAMFRSQSVENKRDVVITESVNLANMAFQYYKKAKLYGGGANSFNGWKIPDNLKKTINGDYTATVDSAEVQIIGTGNDVVSGNEPVKVKTIVNSNSIETIVLN